MSTPAADPRKTLTRVATLQALDVDVSERVIRSAIITDRIAADGVMVLPEGTDTADYLRNPVVLAQHGLAFPGRSSAIGRCLGLELEPGSAALVATTQFADTPQGREWAYLYGLNPEGTVYVRGWSARMEILRGERWAAARAAARLGQRFRADAIPPDQAGRRDWVSVATGTRLIEYSAVEVGADPDALTRCAQETGNEVAARIALQSQLEELRQVVQRTHQEKLLASLRDLTRELSAITGDDATAAADGNAVALLAAAKELVSLAQGQEAAR